jgi:DNA repair protein RecN (Recombination protein N)
VESQLADLNMVGARFAVDFATEPDENGAYVAGERGEERLAFDHNGIDKAEFLMSANPGEPLKPMAKVASGGETSRLMLALKTALAEVDETPTLIFDEIDQGIGGRVGDIVGRKLWGLAAVSAHQVIVVTHLPQLAGYGDRHYHVSKRVNNGRTTTSVMELDWNGRVAELAAMLGTQNEHARAGYTRRCPVDPGGWGEEEQDYFLLIDDANPYHRLYDQGRITYDAAIEALRQMQISKKQRRVAMMTLAELKRLKEG